MQLRDLLILAILSVLLLSPAFAECPADLRVKAERVYEEVAARVSDESRDPLDRAHDALRIGRLDTDDPLLQEGGISDPYLRRVLQTMLHFQRFEFEPVASMMESNFEGQWSSLGLAAEFRTRWLFTTDQLERLKGISDFHLQFEPDRSQAWVTRAELEFLLLDRAEAESLYVLALDAGVEGWLRERAIIGLAKVYVKNREYQRAMDSLCTLMDAATLSADALFEMGTTLIRLGRTSEAIDLFEEAVRWNPWHRLAHYYLGNGYARKNYTQLWEEYDTIDCGDDDVQALMHAESRIDAGEFINAKQLLEGFIGQFPGCPRALVMLGSVEWNQGNYKHAAERFRQALEIVPEYGRAHNGLARALQSYVMTFSVYREHDDKTFASLEIPEVPGIEAFVSNWESLSPRHRKQVALSVAPWKAYVPMLVECGSHHYIKPLHQMLSECPGLSTIADQRISYDSRLWDDVRGCGGYTTVTGIEDVERSIYYGYNTVLHELTHQVHWSFPPQDVRRIEEAFHAADAREEAGTPTYMSRYQASSEYEYIAEGANAMFSPRRNEFDTREIVRERLYQMDTSLVNLVEYYLGAPNLAACYPVGLTNASENALENRDLDLAMVYARRAEQRDPNAQVVLATLANLHSLLDQDDDALDYARELVESYPDKAEAYDVLADVEFFTNGSAPAMIRHLTDGLSKVHTDEVSDLRKALGDACHYAGRYEQAQTLFREVLAEQENDDTALRGLATALGDAGEFAEADSVFQKAVKRRSGVVGLRLDYARMLIFADQLDAAAVQIEEAALLSPRDPSVVAYQGWLLLLTGDADGATRKAEESLELDPDYRFASVVRALAAEDDESRSQIRAMLDSDIPIVKYVESISSYRARRIWPAYLKQIAERI